MAVIARLCWTAYIALPALSVPGVALVHGAAYPDGAADDLPDSMQTIQSDLDNMTDGVRRYTQRPTEVSHTPTQTSSYTPLGDIRITLVTTVLLKLSPHSHEHETLESLVQNLNNRFITDIHVLLESQRGTCSHFYESLVNSTSRRYLKHLRKVRCIDVYQPPTYITMFKHAQKINGTVMISNADVVYDDSLGLLEPPAAGTEGYIVSVKIPPYEGVFADLFKERCNMPVHHHRCKEMAISWDSFIFTTPLPEKLTAFNMNFPMNINTAEYYVAGALTASGLRLRNPCMFVNAWHWHCFGEKTHSSAFAPLPRAWSPLTASWPCIDFPEADCRHPPRKEAEDAAAAAKAAAAAAAVAVHPRAGARIYE